MEEPRKGFFRPHLNKNTMPILQHVKKRLGFLPCGCLPCWLLGPWCAHKSIQGDGYSISHKPTGFCAWSGYRSIGDAKRALVELADREPWILSLFQNHPSAVAKAMADACHTMIQINKNVRGDGPKKKSGWTDGVGVANYLDDD